MQEIVLVHLFVCFNLDRKETTCTFSRDLHFWSRLRLCFEGIKANFLLCKSKMETYSRLEDFVRHYDLKDVNYTEGREY